VLVSGKIILLFTIGLRTITSGIVCVGGCVYVCFLTPVWLLSFTICHFLSRVSLVPISRPFSFTHGYTGTVYDTMKAEIQYIEQIALRERNMKKRRMLQKKEVKRKTN
jgi:hypothetical protein